MSSETIFRTLDERRKRGAREGEGELLGRKTEFDPRVNIKRIGVRPGRVAYGVRLRDGGGG